MAYQFMKIAAFQFVLLTVIAMLIYSGGTGEDPTAPRYGFFENFFSELGLTKTYTGEANTISMVLFVTALVLAGIGLAFFFLALPGLFRQIRPAYALSLAGSIFGIISGLSYVAIALTPADLYLEEHSFFVLAAFSSRGCLVHHSGHLSYA